MNSNGTRKCELCAEYYEASYQRCPHCGGNRTDHSQKWRHKTWQRVREGKLVAGVCTGIAEHMERPDLVIPLRLLFIILLFFHGMAIPVYLMLWFLMPEKGHAVKQQEVNPLAFIFMLVLLGGTFMALMNSSLLRHVILLPFIATWHAGRALMPSWHSGSFGWALPDGIMHSMGVPNFMGYFVYSMGLLTTVACVVWIIAVLRRKEGDIANG